MEIKKLEFTKSHFKDQNLIMQENDLEMMMKINEIVEALNKGILPKTKTKDDFKVILQHDVCSTTATLHYKTNRISIASYGGQTVLDFQNRKVETIESLANCMLEAVKLYKLQKNG